MNAHTKRASALLVNYFQAIAEKAGMKWDADYTCEIEEAIQEIVEGASESARNELADDLDNYVKREALR